MLITSTSRRPHLPCFLRSCSLLFGLSLSLMSQDVEFIDIIKEQQYEQSGEHIVSLLDEDGDNVFQAPFFSEICVETPDTSQITSIIVTPPGRPSIQLTENEDSDGFEALGGYGSLGEINDGFPNGDYLFNLFTVNDGSKSVTLTLTGDNYPSITKFTGYAANKSINAASAKTFNWNAISDGLASDWVFFEIEDENGNTVFETPDPGESGALTGLSTSATISAGLLNAGTTYTAYLFVIRPVDLNEDYAVGVTAVAAYGKSLEMEIRTTGNSGESVAPRLGNIAPDRGVSNVELNSIVTFVFDEAMDTSVDESQAITWTGVANPAQFQYSWSPDGLRLFCNYVPGLPASATIAWQLNPTGSATKLQDIEGNELATGQSGDFTTKGTSNLGVPDVARAEFIKGRFYEQSGADSTTLIDQFMDFYVTLSGVSTVSSVDLLTPGLGSSTNIGEFEYDHLYIDGEALFAEQADLDLIFPNGTYNLTMHTVHDGDKTVALNMNSSAYPNAPVVQNFAATQVWDSTQPLTVTWNAMSGGTNADNISVYIESDNACFFETPEIGIAGALDGTATSVTIPANTLPPGRTMELEIAFIKVLTNDTTQYPGVISASGIASVTGAEIQTIGDPLKPIINIALGGAAPNLTITGEQGLIYEVSTSPDLKTWTQDRWVWLNGDDCEGFLGSGEFFDHGGAGQTSRFYRLRQIEGN